MESGSLSSLETAEVAAQRMKLLSKIPCSDCDGSSEKQQVKGFIHDIISLVGMPMLHDFVAPLCIALSRSNVKCVVSLYTHIVFQQKISVLGISGGPNNGSSNVRVAVEQTIDSLVKEASV